MEPTVYREWSEKSAINAQRLVEEARILFNANRIPRAYYLAHMSTEESAKSILLYAMNQSGAPATELPKVMKLLRNHGKKIEFVVSYAASQSSALQAHLSGLHEELIAHINDLKNNAMYVSCEKGAVLTPDEKISGVSVSTHLGAAEGLANLANSLPTLQSRGQTTAGQA